MEEYYENYLKKFSDTHISNEDITMNAKRVILENMSKENISEQKGNRYLNKIFDSKYSKPILYLNYLSFDL